MIITKTKLERAHTIMDMTQRASVTLFMRLMRLTLSDALDLMDALEELGWIGPPIKGYSSRDILKPGLAHVPRF